MPKFQIRDCLTRVREKEINGKNFEEIMVYTESQLVDERKKKKKIETGYTVTEQDKSRSHPGEKPTERMNLEPQRQSVQERQTALSTARRVH